MSLYYKGKKKCKVKKKNVVKVVNVHVHKPSCTTTDVYMAETSKCKLYIKRNNGTDQICDFVFVSFLMMHLIISFRLQVVKIEDAKKAHNSYHIF